MRVWIDQDCCTGAGLCVDHCADIFVVLDDGIGYVHDHHVVIDEPRRSRRHGPVKLRTRTVIDAVERCPGECIYVEPDSPRPPSNDDDIVYADIVRAATNRFGTNPRRAGDGRINAAPHEGDANAPHDRRRRRHRRMTSRTETSNWVCHGTHRSRAAGRDGRLRPRRAARPARPTRALGHRAAAPTVRRPRHRRRSGAGHVRGRLASASSWDGRGEPAAWLWGIAIRRLIGVLRIAAAVGPGNRDRRRRARA